LHRTRDHRNRAGSGARCFRRPGNASLQRVGRGQPRTTPVFTFRRCRVVRTPVPALRWRGELEYDVDETQSIAARAYEQAIVEVSVALNLDPNRIKNKIDQLPRQ